MTDSNQDVNLSNKTLISLSVGILVVFLALVAFLFFWVQRKNGGKLVFPAGINYTGAENQAPTPARPQYDWASLTSSTTLAKFVSPLKQYTFSHPAQLFALFFPGDPNDSMTFQLSDTSPQFSLTALVETISNYKDKMGVLTGKQEEFVKNYYKAFGAMEGVNAIEPYTSPKGLKGFKVKYNYKGGNVGADNYFFIIPGSPDKILHVINIFPPEGQTIFNNILGSLELVK